MKLNMKNLSKLATLSFTSVILFAASSATFAFDYYDDKPLLFTYQNNSGYWFACGPVQCLQAGEGSEELVIDRVTQDWHGPTKWAGNYGKCSAYLGKGELKSWDKQPSRIISLMERKC